MAAASYRQSSPIIGYSGHLPGAKFHVGSNIRRNGTAYPNATRASQRSNSRTRDENGGMAASVAGYHYDDEGNPVPHQHPQTQRSYRSGAQNQLGVSMANSQNGGSPVFQIPVQFVHTNDVSANSLQIPVHPSMLRSGGAAEEETQTVGGNIRRTAMTGSRSLHDLANNTDRLVVNNEGENGDLVVGSRASNRSEKRRSKSAATKKSRRSSRNGVGGAAATNWQGTEFNGAGAGGGGWSEGQALRNLRRHREINGLPPYTAADELMAAGGGAATTRTAKSGRGGEDELEGRAQTTQTAVQRLGRTPAPGYTGHLIEMHRLQIGKNFTDAAKESRKLQQSYRDSLNGSFMTTRSHSPKRSSSRPNGTQQSRRSHN